MKIKETIKKILPPFMFNSLRSIFYPEKINILERRLQSIFLTKYSFLSNPKGNQRNIFRNAEFKIYTKHGTDGIIAYIFSKIGVVHHKFVELGVETGIECNSANLSLNFGWEGVIVDANDSWIKSAKVYYKAKLGIDSKNVKAVASFITAENINEVLKDSGLTGEIDFLSIDIDGNDYWVWEAVNIINPRLVVVEYNPAMGDRPISIKYDPNHKYRPREVHPLYFGASLSALVKLGKKKGYSLVCCDSSGQDAFFIRNDLLGEIKEVSPQQAYYPNPLHLSVFGSVDKQYEEIKDFEFTEV